jgi:hypothetical protein
MNQHLKTFAIEIGIRGEMTVPVLCIKNPQHRFDFYFYFLFFVVLTGGARSLI